MTTFNAPLPGQNATTGPPEKAPTRPRKLHLGHFAFMRAVVQGLDTKQSWDRYLRVEGEHGDIRNVRRTIAWIRDEFAAAARRSERFGTARLVHMDATQLLDDVPQLPSLEAFAISRGMEDFSESEQLEAYHDEYGLVTQQQSRRRKLINKQLTALTWLEGRVAQLPQADDALGSWLNPDLVIYLERAGFITVRGLINHVNGIGKLWWAGIPAIGKFKAERILDWLNAHVESIGLRIGRHVAIKRSKLFAEELDRVVPRSTAIVPIGKFIMPAALDGTNGAYRAPQRLCLLKAHNDYEALLIWVKAKHGIPAAHKAALQKKRGIDPARLEGPLTWLQYLSNTQRAYLKEAERFMLWAIIQQQKPLSSMTLEDCEAYRSFLADPRPSALWCGPRAREKWSSLWRPFEGPLSTRAQRHAITILRSFYKFLVDQCYLIGNPWNGVLLPKAAGGIDKGHSFTKAHWALIQQQVAMLDDTSANHRLAFALDFIYATGLRLSEAVAARVDDLNWVSYAGMGDEEAIEGWELTVIGKGEKTRLVPVQQTIISGLSEYLIKRGLDADPESAFNRGAHLLGKAVDREKRTPWAIKPGQVIDNKAGMMANSLAAQLKSFFKSCAEILGIADPKSANRFIDASTHWLRHTHGSHAAAAGMPLEILQQNLGHASLNTTTIYVTSEERRRMAAMQTFWGN